MLSDIRIPYSHEWGYQIEAFLPLIFLLLLTLVTFRAFRSIDLRTITRARLAAEADRERPPADAIAGLEARVVSLEESREFADSLLLSRARPSEPKRLLDVAARTRSNAA